MEKPTTEDTIAAIITGTAPNGAVAGIRISGKDAFSIAEKVFSKPLQSLPTHTAHYGTIRSSKNESIDHVLLLIMKGPKSYTGEDTVEIFSHGGSVLPKKILQIILEKGARAAKPGEFTLRAYLNQKIDLAQAEAVQKLIAAKNDFAVKAAKEQLEGKLSKKIQAYQKRLTHFCAILEAWVDFPEEDLGFIPTEEFLAGLSEISHDLSQLITSYENGAKLQEGISLCIAGAPNAGKSSLLNLLLKKEKAIVTDIEGTTRDLIEEDLLLEGLSFRIKDTAGIRPTCCVIEQKGIEKSKEAMQESDLVLYMVDSSNPQIHLNSLDPEKTLIVWNKIDQKKPETLFPNFSNIAISVKEEKGITELLQKVTKLAQKKDYGKEEIFLTSQRHKEALEEASLYLEKVLASFQEKVSAEFIASDVKEALNALAKITGENVTERILDAIFSEFCLGK